MENKPGEMEAKDIDAVAGRAVVTKRRAAIERIPARATAYAF